jgi:hypothetical protein
MTFEFELLFIPARNISRIADAPLDDSGLRFSRLQATRLPTINDAMAGTKKANTKDDSPSGSSSAHSNRDVFDVNR